MVSLYVFFTLLYSIFSSGTTSPVGLMLWGTLLSVLIVSLPQFNFKGYGIFLSAVFIYGIVHIAVADTSPLTMGLVFANILLYICLIQIQIQYIYIVRLLIAFFIINLLFNLGQLYDSISATRVNDYFYGFLHNANTNGLYAAEVLAATLLFVKNKKIRYFVIILFFIYLIGCHSRNLLLFCLISYAFYRMQISRFSKWSIPLFLIFILGSLYYLIAIEPSMAVSGFEIFGKKASSAGRSSQIIGIISHFDLTLFGVGFDLPNNYSIRNSHYAVHNMYVNSLYSMGIVYFILYIYFIYSKLYKKLQSPLAKAFLLSFSIYFMFEPGTFFYVGMFSIPIIILLLKLNQEQNENRTLYLCLQHRRC